MADMQIRPPKGSRKSKRIAGRGPGGWRGATAGKGDKGQNARSGGGVRPGFEGGQMPLYRRIPIKGFSNYPFKKAYEVINVSALDSKFEDGDTVTLDTLREKRILKKKFAAVKILGDGKLTKKLTVAIEKVSTTAREKIVGAGGSVIVSDGEAAEAPKDERAEASAAASTPEPEAKTPAEKPKAEKPKAEKPKAEKPKAEKPKTEKPKAETKAEKPKTEEQPAIAEETDTEEEGRVDGE